MTRSAISFRQRLEIVVGLILLHTGVQSVYSQSSTTATPPPEVEISRWDRFLSIPPEYAALIGLGICFFLLFVVVIVIICITGRGKKL